MICECGFDLSSPVAAALHDGRHAAYLAETDEVEAEMNELAPSEPPVTGSAYSFRGLFEWVRDMDVPWTPAPPQLAVGELPGSVVPPQSPSRPETTQEALARLMRDSR